MGTITDRFSSTFRDFVIDGVRASGPHEVDKSEVRTLGSLLENSLGTVGMGSMVDVIHATRAALDADLAYPAASVGLVYADGTDANNDLYVKTGASGSGAWTLTDALHSIQAGLSIPVVAAAREAALEQVQTALTDAIGYAAQARRFVGITVPLVGAPSDGGSANGWMLPVQPRAMIYDIIFLTMSAPATGQLVVWTAANDQFRRAQVIALPALVAGHQAITQKVYVPAGGTVSFERLTGGDMMLSGFSASPSHNGWLPLGGAIGDLASATATSADYGFGASGYAIDEAPAQLRTAAEARANQQTYPLPKQYIIGTWLPRAAELATWQSRGVNTVITEEADYAVAGQGDAWLTTWAATNMDLIYRTGRWSDASFTALQHLTQVQADAVNARVIAFCLPDEFDLVGHPAQPNYQGAFDRSVTPLYVDQEIAEHRMVAPRKPFFANLSGYNTSLGLTVYGTYYFNDPNINWWSTDQYPNVGTPAGFLMPFQTTHEKFVSTCIGMTLRQIIQQDMNFGGGDAPTLAAGKPGFFFLATGRTDVNPAQYENSDRWRCIAWSGIINGASGHCYFPQYPNGPTGYISDDSSPELLAEMAKLHSAIAILNNQSALMDSVAGGRIPYRLRPCPYAPMTDANQAAAFITPRDEQLPGPFEGCEIYLASGDVLRLVLNLTASAQSLTDPRWGYTALSFGAYEVKAFLASAPTTNLFAGVYA